MLLCLQYVIIYVIMLLCLKIMLLCLQYVIIYVIMLLCLKIMLLCLQYVIMLLCLKTRYSVSKPVTLY